MAFTSRVFVGMSLAAAMIIAAAAEAAPAAKSKVEAKAEASPSGLTLSFRVVPEAGLHINEEGPWQLDLPSAPGLTLASTTLKKDQVNFKLPGFAVATTAAPSQASGSVAYRLVAFVCTNDKAQCYRDVLTGDLSWKR